MLDNAAWWRTASIYQIYVRSFGDASGDGIGDLAGIQARLPYLRDLGVDALWLTPWYVSPMADAGYDVADYRNIDPLFGTLAEAEELIGDVHSHGLRMIIDIVPNHCSDQHPWFQAALVDPAQRDRFFFRPGRGPDGSLPPNNWQSYFGGSAWQRVADGAWYLHLFAPEQPDLNWDNPEVRADFEETLRFWFDRGADGFRIDVAHGLVKEPGLPDTVPGQPLPYEDQPGVHDIYRAWRRIADSYPQQRIFVGEIWVATPAQLTRYLRPDELNTAFNFKFLESAFDATAMRQVIDETLATHRLVGAPPTWVLSNHDVTRHVTRYGRANTTYDGGHRLSGVPVDLDLGVRRARAAAMLTFCLPGDVYIYQGDELGLAEVEDIPDALLQDPVWKRSGHTDRGRDGCRVPIPWSGTEPSFGFSPTGRSWLPQPAAWKALTAEAESGDPGSMHSLYRRALALRRASIASLPTEIEWLDAPADVLAFRRGDFVCVLNFSATPVPLHAYGDAILTSGPLDAGSLPSDTCAWFTV
jgi:alpha-glucosidase